MNCWYRCAVVIVVVSMLGAGIGLGSSQDDDASIEAVREKYTKHEYRIPMRDGVKLFTAVYVPKDTSERHPMLMQRTPYSVGPYGEDNYGHVPEAFVAENYIFVFQDVRGRFMSEGEFDNMRPHLDKKTSNSDIDESSDTYDTIDWLVKNIPNNNGRVGNTVSPIPVSIPLPG